MRLQLTSQIDYLIEQLKTASILGEYIEVDKNIRGIGKTTALGKFAKEFGFTVIVPFKHLKTRFKYLCDYEKVITQYEVDRQPVKTKFVFDEGVNLELLRGLDVVTGFRTID